MNEAFKLPGTDTLGAMDRAVLDVMNDLPVMIWQGRNDGSRSFFNRNWLEFTGLSLADVKEMGWLQHVHPDDRSRFDSEFTTVDDGEDVGVREYRLRHRSGVFRWIREEVRRLDPNSLIGCCFDIHQEREQKERQSVIWQNAEEDRRWLAVTLSSIGDGVIATDAEGNIVFINPVAEQLTGFSAAEAVGVPVGEVFRIVHEADGTPAEVPAKRVLHSGRPMGLANAIELLAKDGTRRPIADSAAPIRSESGDEMGVVMVFQDMSFRKEAERKISALLQDYEQIFKGVSHPLFLVDVEPGPVFRYRRFNPANEMLVGLSTQQIVGLTPPEIFGDEIGADIERRFTECIQSRKPYVYMARRRFAAGIKVQQVYLTPVIQDGMVVQLVGSAYDLTEQAEVEAKLKVSEEHFRSLFNNMRDMACVYRFRLEGPAGLFVEVNRTMMEVLGYTREELMGMGPGDLDPVEDMEVAYREYRDELVRTGKAEFRASMITRSGDVVPTEARAIRIHYQDEDCVLVTLRNISDRLQWEERVQHHLIIEKAISQVLSLMIRRDEVDFDRICAILGEAVDCSTAFIYVYDKEEILATKMAQWIADHVETVLPLGRKTDTRRMPWYYSILRKEGVLVMADVENLPPEAAAEKEDLQSGQIKAVLNVAFYSRDDRMVGFLGFTDHRSPRDWRIEDIELLRSVAEVMGVYFDQLEVEARIRHLSFHDQVTGLYNRAYFEEELQRMDTPRQLPLSILMGDVNGLKLINDAFGHSEGDRFLAKIARTLQRACRQEDLIARWGGDEFIMLLPRTDQKSGERLIERIRQSLAADEEELLTISMALGVATKVSDDQPVDQIIREAEDRMYQNKLLESQSFRSAVISSLENTLWERSHETEEHTRRMQSWAVRLGKELGLAENQLDELKLLTSLHDIGKIAIPDRILNKTGPLTEEEWAIMRRHAEIGYRIASASNDLLPIATGILTHHERWDGSGYPQGLKEDQIPATARIVAVVDAFDVMLHDRPYRKALTYSQALQELKQGAGTQFDPKVVALFLEMLGKEDVNPSKTEKKE